MAAKGEAAKTEKQDYYLLLCQRIDDALILLLQVNAEMVAVRKEAEKALKEGYFAMTQARMACPRLDMTSSNYQHRDMHASIGTVFTQPSSSLHIVTLPQKKGGSREKDVEAEDLAVTSANDSRSSSSSSRSRSSKSSTSEDTDTHTNKVTASNLLGSTWFGILAPPELVLQTPQHFRSSLDLWVRVATFQNSITAQEKELERLLEEKKHLQMKA